jgi:hypothetical protein
MRGSLYQITTFTDPTATQAENAELPLLLEEAFHHSYVDLPYLVSVEATGVSIHIGNSEILLASVNKY